MKSIAVYSLTSGLHDEKNVQRMTEAFLESLKLEYTWRGNDYDDYGTAPLNLIYVRTGGTEGIFRQLLPTLLEKTDKPFFLLTSGKSNSLAASMEILAFLRSKGLRGEIIHGSADFIRNRVSLLERVATARNQLHGSRLGVIGKPSDWLIASTAEPAKVKERLGLSLVDIPMEELLEEIRQTPVEEVPPVLHGVICGKVERALPDAWRIYRALRTLVYRHRLGGFTLRCFDLLTAVHNTGCLALAQLNAEGVVAGCEGDVPALLSMSIAQALLGVVGFQANPASINPETGEMVFAHCTIPFNLVRGFELDTHFESGIGVGIRGEMKEGPVTIFKVAGDLSRFFVEEGTLLRNEAKPDLCRTQLVIQLADKEKTAYFLTQPIGNHHIILPGRHKALLTEMMAWSGPELGLASR